MEEKRGPGRPPKVPEPTEPETETTENNTEPQREKKTDKLRPTCSYITQKPKQVVVTFDGIYGESDERRMLWEGEPCANSVNGQNGFCKEHSYPVLKPVSKQIEISETSYRSAGDGKVTPKTTTRLATVLWNVGEHLPTDHFTDKEIDELFKFGFIGQRISQSHYLQNEVKRSLADNEIIDLLNNNSPDNVVGVIRNANYNTETLMKIYARTTNGHIQDALKKILG